MFARLRVLLHHLNHSKMSTAAGLAAITTANATTAAMVHNTNVACCTIPPVRSAYEPKGSYRPYAGFNKVYFTGPENSAIAVVAVYDIFGMKPQTQLGADKLAASLGATVVMPDFFEPSAPWDPARFPPQIDADRAELQAFFGGPARPQDAVGKLLRVGRALREDGMRHVGAYGLCWGGKVTILGGSEPGAMFDAVAAVHPAMLSAPDAINLNAPLGLFISKDEPKAEYDKIVKVISDKPFASLSMYKLYPTMFHGWAGARANLHDPENRKQFEHLYATLRKFFSVAFENDDGRKPAKL